MSALQTPSLASVILAAIESRVGQIYTALPGRVTSYDASDRSANVQLIIRDAYTDEQGVRQTEQYPLLQHVPVMFPGSGPYSITWPIAVDDTVLVVFSHSSLDRWLANGGDDVDPADDRRHTLSDAVAIPGLRDFTTPVDSGTASTDAMTLTAGDLRLGGSGVTALNQVVIQQALEDFKTALDNAIADPAVSGDASASLALNTLWNKLLALNAGTGWLAMTTVTKAK